MYRGESVTVLDAATAKVEEIVLLMGRELFRFT
jgi:hypothetical protein